MKLESAVAKVRKVRIATSITVAIIIVVMGILSTRDGVNEASQNTIFWLAITMMLLSVIFPISYTIYLSRKGPDIPPDDENENK